VKYGDEYRDPAAARRFAVRPLVFPGGDIGRLTVNDLAMFMAGPSLAMAGRAMPI